MALNANAIVDLASTKRYIKVPLAIVTDDDLIESFINEVSALVEMYCNRKFITQTITEIRDGGGTSQILLHQWPVASIVSVHEDASRLFGAETLLDAANYTVRNNESQEGILLERLDNVFSRGQATVKVVYAFGYADFAAIPGDLQLATKRTIGYYWKQQQNQDFAETNKSKGDENITLIDGIPEAASLILDNYKRWEMLATPDPVRNR